MDMAKVPTPKEVAADRAQGRKFARSLPPLDVPPLIDKDTLLTGMYQVHGQRYTSHQDGLGRQWGGSQQLPTMFVEASSHREAANKARDFAHMPLGGNFTTMHQDSGSIREHEMPGDVGPSFWGADIPEDSTDW